MAINYYSMMYSSSFMPARYLKCAWASMQWLKKNKQNR